MKNELSAPQSKALLSILKSRFEKNSERHKGLDWGSVQSKLEANPTKLWSLNEMERTGGEPDVVLLSTTHQEANGKDKKINEFVFFDCSAESPAGRRSFCYDKEALQSRKEHKPKDSAMNMAQAIGIELLSEAQYRDLQKVEHFDKKTSSWLETPADIRKLGGAIFGDFRYNTVFIYHNGAESYYAARGFRGLLRV